MKRLLLACLLALGAALPAIAEPLPRSILALYDSKVETRLRFSNAHQLAAMPLNHLGLVVEFHDIRQPLPKLQDRRDLRGLLMWLAGNSVPDAEGLWRWLDGALDQGLRVVVIGDLPTQDEAKGPLQLDRINRVLRRIGAEDAGDWQPVSLGSHVARRDAAMVEFERAYDEMLPPHSAIRPVGPDAVSHLAIRRERAVIRESHPVITSDRGGFIAPGFAFHRDPTYLRTRWHINPFAFFRRAFATDDLPKPDTTTLNGRRIFYSHVDGDGWLNLSAVPQYAKRRAVAAEVILAEIAEGYRDLPVTIAPVVAELDPDWHGSREAMEIARRFFSLPNVEPASHTYSHPFQWGFFERYDPSRERPFQAIYRSRGQKRYEPLDGKAATREADAAREAGLLAGYRMPRAYGDKPFNADTEIAGAIDFLQRLAPPEKPVRLVQWSGDTSPSSAILARTRLAGALNINGGDSRFDAEYPSYSAVAPLGLRQGGEVQVYASNSNENTYTDLWTNRFFGQRYVRETWVNTETPVRIKPINLYYHIYSGERLASLTAVKENLDWVRGQEIAPVSTHRFAAIVQGFFQSTIEQIDAKVWHIRNRGNLQTIRFDGEDSRLAPDYDRSKGVLGHRHVQRSLYVALDGGAAEALIALSGSSTAPPRPILQSARWDLRDLACATATACAAEVQGYGEGSFVWHVPGGAGTWRIRLASGTLVIAETEARSEADGRLSFTLPSVAGTTPTTLRFQRADP